MKDSTLKDQGLRDIIEAALARGVATVTRHGVPASPRVVAENRTGRGNATATVVNVEAETSSVGGANAEAETANAEAAGAATPLSPIVVGEVLDTHHPHLPGRVFVRWLDINENIVERWLQRERHLSLRKYDRVLLTLPAGWNEWVVTGSLGCEPAVPATDLENRSNVHLGPGEVVRILSHDGLPLLTLRQGQEGPVIELGDGNVELVAARTLRLSADAIEISSATGGIDLRTEGDTVVRARTIRLN